MPSKQIELSEYTKWQLDRLTASQLTALLGEGESETQSSRRKSYCCDCCCIDVYFGGSDSKLVSSNKINRGRDQRVNSNTEYCATSNIIDHVKLTILQLRCSCIIDPFEDLPYIILLLFDVWVTSLYL